MQITTVVLTILTSLSQPVESPDTASAVALAYALHLNQVAEFPVEYGVHAYFAAEEQGIDAYDLAAYIVSENSWKYGDLSLSAALDREVGEMDYEQDQLGGMGEIGIAQIAPSWLRKAKRDCEKEGWVAGECELFDEDEAFDPRTNIRLAAFVVRMAHESHAEHEVTYEDIRKCKRQWRKFDRGERKHVPTCQLFDHGWGAHLKLGPGDRDKLCGQPGYQKRKLRKVRASITAIVPPADVWEEAQEEWQHACGGES